MSERGAIAAFVKTIGRSPVKTRLAAAIGDEQAKEFYRLCLLATQAAVHRACGTNALDAYWSVAEAEALGDKCWHAFTTIAQGDGDLGRRLDRVYRALLRWHPYVVLIGADAPLLSAELIESAARAMKDPSGPAFAISRSRDGGYALFAGRRPIAVELWGDVPYSSSRTADVFVSHLEQIGEVLELPGIDDIDTVDDLRRLVRDVHRCELLPAQAAVVHYARHIVEPASEVS